MADIVPSLFGLTPGMYQQAQQQRGDEMALQYAKLDPFQQANYAIGRGAYGLAGAAGGLLGGQDPELQRITRRQQIASQVDFTNPQSIQEGITLLGDDIMGKQQLAAIYRQQLESGALIGQREAAALASSAAAQQSAAQTGKIELSVKQETQLRDELSKLPAGATETDIRGVLVKYGDPDKVLAALTSAATRAEDRALRESIAAENVRVREDVSAQNIQARKDVATEALQARKDLAASSEAARADSAKLANEARIEAERIRAEARVDAAREAGASRLQIANIQAQNRRDLAELTASLKGPSPAVLKAQEKADKIAEGQAALGDTISTAQTLVKDLAKMGGMTSTSQGPLSNLITSLGTGTIGQTMGRMTGTSAQTKRDELKSIRLQLLNAVKEATGMSSQQLNSNVELKTYLDSLGSENMTQEANLAILNNISNRYLKKGAITNPSKESPMSSKDQQALDWANANPNDARAAAIKKKLGM